MCLSPVSELYHSTIVLQSGDYDRVAVAGTHATRRHRLDYDGDGSRSAPCTGGGAWSPSNARWPARFPNLFAPRRAVMGLWWHLRAQFLYQLQGCCRVAMRGKRIFVTALIDAIVSLSRQPMRPSGKLMAFCRPQMRGLLHCHVNLFQGRPSRCKARARRAAGPDRGCAALPQPPSEHERCQDVPAALI